MTEEFTDSVVIVFMSRMTVGCMFVTMFLPDEHNSHRDTHESLDKWYLTFQKNFNSPAIIRMPRMETFKELFAIKLELAH